MLKLIRDAIRLDIYDLNFTYSSERIGALSLPLQTGLPRRGILLRVGSFFWQFLRSSLTVRFKALRPLPANHVLLFAVTKNQLDVFQTLKEKMSNASLIGIRRRAPRNISLFAAYFISLFFLPVLLYRMISARGYQRRSYKMAFDFYWITYGYYILGRRLMRRLAPASLVVANDHVIWTRTLSQAARDESVKTFYVQHASVTDKFPPLAFDYALLEGRDALLKYDSIGHSETRVFLTGSPKYDPYREAINTTGSVQTVGICTNKFETIEAVEDLCRQLRQSFPSRRLILRPHPGDKRVSNWKALDERYQLGYSDSRIKVSFEFLKGVDVVVAGESNILLEGALMNVYPVYYDFEDIQRDAYGFLRHGLVERRLSQPEELCQLLAAVEHNRPNVRGRAKFYCETVDTPNDGRSVELCNHIITALSKGEEIDMTKWDPVPDLKNLQAYSPR